MSNVVPIRPVPPEVEAGNELVDALDKISASIAKARPLLAAPLGRSDDALKSLHNASVQITALYADARRARSKGYPGLP